MAIEDADTDQKRVVEQLETRLRAVETKLDDHDEAISSKSGSGSGSESGSGSTFDDPELTHKVLHACMRSDAISEAEELEILKAVLQE